MQNRKQSKPKLGQNFLMSATAPAAIVRGLGNLSDAVVLEIGPGRGAITDLLAQSAKRLIAVEYDRALAAQLTERYATKPHVEILTADIRMVDLETIAASAGHTLRVVGNLPYGITSEILLHLFASHAAIDRAVLMVQREVADRITAAPGNRDYGLLTVTTQLYGDAESLFTLPPSDFAPPPEVYSTVFRLEVRPRFEELHVEPARFLQFLRRCFAQKRKMLANNLRHAGYTPGQVHDAFRSCELDPSVRAEALPIALLACLYRHLAPVP